MPTNPKTSATNPGGEPEKSEARPEGGPLPGPANTAVAESRGAPSAEDAPSKAAERRAVRYHDHQHELARSGLPTFGRAITPVDEQPDGKPDPMVGRTVRGGDEEQ